MKIDGSNEIGLASWFIRQRVLELTILAVTAGSLYAFHAYIGPLVLRDVPPSLSLEPLYRYVMLYSATAFAFVIAVQISVIVWIACRHPPRPPQRTAWRT